VPTREGRGFVTTPVNLFTVDLEEWFHICGVGGELDPVNWDRLPSRVEQTTRLLLDLLSEVQVPATFFIVGWVADRHPRLIDEVRAAGHTIGSHSYSHARAYDLGPVAFREDLRRSVRTLADAGAGDVWCFRAPEWSINNRSLWALETLAAEGFRVDASMAPLKMVGDPAYPRAPHHRSTARGTVLEVPPLVADRFGHVMPMGWGWGLRMSAPSRVTRAIGDANRRGLGAVLTVHPWEIDPDPPRVRLRPRLRFAHYFRLSGFLDRLREVLRSTTFGRLDDLTSEAELPLHARRSEAGPRQIS
jgi:polysaccharide deacetylase family protein (PEP-CTERM system associated)